jgi:predicted N-acetyltransferase YhbS
MRATSGSTPAASARIVSAVTIRPESESDREAIAKVHRAAFGRDEEGAIVERLRASDAYLPEFSLVAELHGEVAGHTILSLGRLDDRPALALGPIGVLPERQRAGVGSALMRASLDRAREQGHQLVVLLGHPEYYPRFGFVPAETLGIMGGWSGPAFMALELVPGGAGAGGLFTFPAAFDPPVH